MAVKASSQVTLVDLTDAYGVVVGSEAHVFMGDTDSVKSTQTTSFMVSAMRGSEQVPCTVGKITCPTGISAVSDGKSPSPTITVTATTALKSGGALDIPVTIDGGIVIHKTFSYSIAFTGATGATGAAGKGIKSATTTYQAGTSGTTPPSGEWQSTIPSVSAGQYLWTRTVTAYTDGTSTTAYAVGKMGNTGATGSAGKGVKSTAITYNVHTVSIRAQHNGRISDIVMAFCSQRICIRRTLVKLRINSIDGSFCTFRVLNINLLLLVGRNSIPFRCCIQILTSRKCQGKKQARSENIFCFHVLSH